MTSGLTSTPVTPCRPLFRCHGDSNQVPASGCCSEISEDYVESSVISVVYWYKRWELIAPHRKLYVGNPARPSSVDEDLPLLIGAFSSNVWNWTYKLSKNQLNHSILFYLCAERRTSRECVCLMAARHRYLFLRYALLNQTTLNMQNNRYVTWYTFTFPLIP